MTRKVQFGLDSLRVLDLGQINQAFQNELERIVKDCMDRPHLEKARQITIRFLFEPVSDSNRNDCDRVSVGCHITSGIPKRESRTYEMVPTVNGQLVFHPELPDDPAGSTLYDPQSAKEDESDS